MVSDDFRGFGVRNIEAQVSVILEDDFPVFFLLADITSFQYLSDFLLQFPYLYSFACFIRHNDERENGKDRE